MGWPFSREVWHGICTPGVVSTQRLALSPGAPELCRGRPDHPKPAEEDGLTQAARPLAARMRLDRNLLIDGCPLSPPFSSRSHVRIVGLWFGGLQFGENLAQVANEVR